jgi:D-glycero-alpha-D-manno-heptose-7-phosphate kinase
MADIVLELEHNLLLAYTGRTRRGDHIIEDQTARLAQQDRRALEGLRRQKELVIEMKDALLRRRVDDFGCLLDEAWKAKKLMSDRISNPQIDEMYDAAKRHGALGGKVTGAGGGGYMLLYCDYRSKHKVAQALEKLGATVSEFAFENEGLRTWRVSGSS